MIRVTYKDVTAFETHKFCVEASDLGIKPGERPNSISTDMGNKLPFVLYDMDDRGTFLYRQQLGCIYLHVLND